MNPSSTNAAHSTRLSNRVGTNSSFMGSSFSCGVVSSFPILHELRAAHPFPTTHPQPRINLEGVSIMKSIIAIVLAAACAMSAPASAQESQERSALLPSTIGLHIGSRHSAPGYNDHNLGIYARWANAQGDGFAAGTYLNSQRATSVWAGYAWSWRMQALPLSAGLIVGGVSGYRAAKIMPMALPSAALHWGNTAARLSYVPRVEKSGAAALHLSLEYTF
jgi:hypothetical protein